MYFWHQIKDVGSTFLIVQIIIDTDIYFSINEQCHGEKEVIDCGLMINYWVTLKVFLEMRV